MKHRILSLACLFSIVTFTSAEDWSHWRGPWQNGLSPEKNLPDKWSPDGENVIWKAHYGCRSTPLVLNGRVYIINYAADRIKKDDGKVTEDPRTIEERVMCFDEKTGKVLAEYKFPVFHTDIVTVRLGWTNLASDPKTGNIYAHGTQGLLLCLDKDLKLKWQRSLTEEYGRITGYGGRVNSPAVDGDLVIIGMLNSSWGDQAKGANRYVAFNKDTGEVVWWSTPFEVQKGTYYSVPVFATINNQRLYITGASEGSVLALKVNTGEKVWSYKLSIAAINSSPVVDGNLVYIGQGEENDDTNVNGRVVCVDASKVKDGKPELVWKVDGITARYASPILDAKAGRLYMPDDGGTLYCLDAKTGDQIWKKRYGRNARGSPVLADGKIYVGDVFSRFIILKPGDKKCDKIHDQYITAPDGSDVEVNGSPAIANGRIFFGSSDEFFCLGLKDAAQVAVPRKADKSTAKPKATHLQIVPADAELAPGKSLSFKLRTFDEDGHFIKELAVKNGAWTLPTPPLPPGAKQPPPPLKGEIAEGKLTVDAKMQTQQGYVLVKADGLTAKARVRVVPNLPYTQTFEKLPDGAVPGGWVGAGGKFAVTTLEGKKVLKKVNDKLIPVIMQGNTYIGLPSWKDYTIQCDVMGTKKGEFLPEIGIIANRYNLYFAGNASTLSLKAWEALPRLDKSIAYPLEPGKWYRMKLTVASVGAKGMVKGKVWPRDDKEPAAWTVELEDPSPMREGAAALYGYVTGLSEPTPGKTEPGNNVYYDNLSITPNKAAKAAPSGQASSAAPSPQDHIMYGQRGYRFPRLAHVFGRRR
jgi:outer membrane protein assembly factor BamB